MQLQMLFMQVAIEAIKTASQAMPGVKGLEKRNNVPIDTPSMSTRSSGQALKQLTLNWEDSDRYNKLLHFEMEV